MSEWKPLRGGAAPIAPKKDDGGGKVVVGLAIGAVGCMVLVGVIGILAAIAIPNFLAMQHRAKRAEGPSVLNDLRTAEIAYIAEHGELLPLGPCPASPPGRNPRSMDEPCAQAAKAVGWRYERPLRCSYEVRAVASGPEDDGPDFTASVLCDVDGDGDEASYSASRDRRPEMLTPNNVY